jgi:hypothetical protein
VEAVSGLRFVDNPKADPVHYTVLSLPMFYFLVNFGTMAIKKDLV